MTPECDFTPPSGHSWSRGGRPTGPSSHTIRTTDPFPQLDIRQRGISFLLLIDYLLKFDCPDKVIPERLRGVAGKLRRVCAGGVVSHMRHAMETVIPYETRLNQNPRWALLEGSMHFEKESA